MKNKKNQRNSYMHLYNPIEEGLGSYDINYMNACKRVSIVNPMQQPRKGKNDHKVVSNRRAA